jgi:tetratricopeptide (TPR) repeat protein
VDLDMLEQLADALDDDRRRAEVAWRRGIRALRMADWAALESAARQGMACATRASDDGLRLHALRLLAAAKVFQGDIDTGRALALQGLAEARSLGLRGVEGRMVNVLSLAADKQGDVAGALDLFQRALEIFRETGDRVNEAIGLSNLGEGRMNLGDLTQARSELDAALRLLRANGDRAIESLTLCYLSKLAMWRGDETLALALARSALDVATAAQARDAEVLAGIRLGDAEQALGRLAAARQAFTRARARALEIDSPWQHDASAGLARVALTEQDNAVALVDLQPVLDHVEACGALDGTNESRRIELTCHRVLARTSNPRAADWLARAHGALMVQADTITDFALRQGFLQNIPHHREIVAAWAQRGAGGE